eukprot:1157543-Pelagomonas_calceolata.AAC.10
MSQCTCGGPFQLATEPGDLHNSNCDGILSLCFIDGVRCCVYREVKARKFADAMWSMTCPDVWMREPLVYGAACMARAQLCMHACMNKAWPAAGLVLFLPQAPHINATSVSGRTGFANFSVLLATLLSLVLVTLDTLALPL